MSLAVRCALAPESPRPSLDRRTVLRSPPPLRSSLGYASLRAAASRCARPPLAVSLARAVAGPQNSRASIEHPFASQAELCGDAGDFGAALADGVELALEARAIPD